MATTMKDIARDLGASVVTVSKVSRNRSDIAENTRKRVVQRMKGVNLQSNSAVRALLSGPPHLIGLIVPDLVHPYLCSNSKAYFR
jgi:LacI family transcriptional regulator